MKIIKFKKVYKKKKIHMPAYFPLNDATFLGGAHQKLNSLFCYWLVFWVFGTLDADNRVPDWSLIGSSCEGTVGVCSKPAMFDWSG